MPVCSNICWRWREEDKDFMVIASPHKVAAKGGFGLRLARRGEMKCPPSMSELCLHLGAATYATASHLAMQNLSWFDQLFWVGLILSRLDNEGLISSVLLSGGISLQLTLFKQGPRFSPGIPRHIYEGIFSDVSNIRELKRWSAFILSVSWSRWIQILKAHLFKRALTSHLLFSVAEERKTRRRVFLVLSVSAGAERKTDEREKRCLRVWKQPEKVGAVITTRLLKNPPLRALNRICNRLFVSLRGRLYVECREWMFCHPGCLSYIMYHK